METGAKLIGNNRCFFTVWAPLMKRMVLHIVHPEDRSIEMTKNDEGYFTAEVDAGAGTRYFLAPNGGKDLPDPASRYQPDGVHGPSEVVDHNFSWTDAEWKPPAFDDLILYELHIGTFTPEGTFEAAISKLDHIAETGINAIEIMPVAQYPGNRNWGYDGVYPYAVQNSYGGPDGLKKFVDACHKKSIAVLLDVVYNHQGPEGNYIGEFAPYFTDHYKTAWGQAINFDGDYSDGVRDFYRNNALYWLRDFHIDGLRFDAVHAIYDFGALHFWEFMHEGIRELEKQNYRPYYTIAESDLNAPRVIEGKEKNGYGFTAQWLDDFHHALYVLLDKRGKDRYFDFGDMKQLAKAYVEGFVHSGEYVTFRKRKYGRSSAGIPGNKFVVFANNHDQSGNRIDGARLSSLVGMEQLKIAAASLLLSPYIPMLFMGEEYGEDAPFFYFISHSDEALIKAVQEGRKEEFRAFIKENDTYPDPQSEDVFLQSKLQWDKVNQKHYKLLHEWHKELILIRRTHPAMKNYDKDSIRVETLEQQGFILHRKDATGKKELLCFVNISNDPISYFLPGTNGSWKKLIDSTGKKWVEENSSTSGAEVPESLQAGEQVNMPAHAVIVLGKEID